MRLCEYWNNVNPPTHELVASYLEFDSGEGGQKEPVANEMELQMLARTPVRQFDSLPKCIQDALMRGKEKK